MQKFLQLFILITGMFFSFSVTAETVIVPRAVNVRSSKIFYGQGNILTQIPEDSKVEIISRWSLASGANALEIKIVSPENKLYLNAGQPIYIWESENELKKDLFKTEASAICTNCTSESLAAQSATKSLKKIAKEIEEEQSEDPDLVQAAKKIETEDREPHDIPEEKNLPSHKTGSLDEKIQAYSSSLQVAKMIQWSKDNASIGRKKNGNFDGYCYRHVKEAMATKTKRGQGEGNNLIPKWYPSGNAVTGGRDLKSRGFINLLDTEPYKTDMKNPKNVPRGAIMIYSTTNHRYGHAEVKLDDDSYYFGIITKNSKANRKDYKLLGVWIKDPL
jgi:hypothetical protein